MAISFKSLAGGKSQQTVILTSTQSWTAPAGVTIAEVFLVGGGGGGGNYASATMGSGGGGGGVIQQSLAVTPGTSYAVTIGAGGSSNAKGGDSTFGSLLTAYGGGSGNAYAAGIAGQTVGSGGGGGDGSRGGAGGGAFPLPTTSSAPYETLQVNIVHGTLGYQTSYMASGNPGVNGYGAGGGYGTNQQAHEGKGGLNAGKGGNNAAGTAATAGVANYGGGGGGGSSSYATGANGGSGVCIIKYWA